MTNAEKTSQFVESIQYLRKILAPKGENRATVFTILRKVSASGMTRDISFVTVVDGNIRDITWHVGNATTYKPAKGEGLRVSGCGMDMGFSVVYNLGAALWPNGTPEPHGTRNGEVDSEGGYAIKHAWL